MRMYFITNMYLSSIQNGIQPAHVVHEVFRKYRMHEETQACKELYEWADNHKTIMVVNGGMTEHMEVALELVRNAAQGSRTEGARRAFGTFYEPGIGNALTTIGIVVPSWYYGENPAENAPVNDINVSDLALIEWMMARPLAR